jgi:hypothetical protein
MVIIGPGTGCQGQWLFRGVADEGASRLGNSCQIGVFPVTVFSSSLIDWNSSLLVSSSSEVGTPRWRMAAPSSARTAPDWRRGIPPARSPAALGSVPAPLAHGVREQAEGIDRPFPTDGPAHLIDEDAGVEIYRSATSARFEPGKSALGRAAWLCSPCSGRGDLQRGV